jgi:hypothetical protein
MPCYTKVSEGGIAEKKVLMEKKNGDKEPFMLRTDRSYRISNSEVVTILEDGNQFRFVRFKIE